MRPILFCRSGGGMPGLDVHAGISLALEEAGIRSTDNAGCSAGAIAGAFDSRGFTARGFRDIVLNLGDRDVRSPRFAWKLRAPWVDWFLENDPIRRLLQHWLPSRTSEYVKSLQVSVTRCADGASVWLPSRWPFDLRECVLASMAVPGVFPSVNLGGVEYEDGGTRLNLAVPSDLSEYDEVWILIAASHPSTYKGNGHSMLGRMLRAVAYLQYAQIELTLEAHRSEIESGKCKVIWPELGHPLGMLHFDHRLVEAAYRETCRLLRNPAERLRLSNPATRARP